MTKATLLRERLQAAADFVGADRRRGMDAASTIGELVALYGGSYRRGPSTYILRVAGVQVTCTRSCHESLLDAWRKNATLKLMQLAGRSDSEKERVV